MAISGEINTIIFGIVRMREVCGGGAIWHLTDPKKLMIYLGFPTEPEKTEARRTDFSRYFRQLDNPDYIPRALDFNSPRSKVQWPKSQRFCL